MKDPTTAELESKLRCVISHATGGACDDINLSLNEIGVRITRHVNLVWKSAQEAALAKATPSPAIERAKEALEAGLMTANQEQLAREIAQILHDEIESDDDSDGGAYLRAGRRVAALTTPAATEPVERQIQAAIDFAKRSTRPAAPEPLIQGAEGDDPLSIACLIWAHLCPGLVMSDNDLPHYLNAANAALAELGLSTTAPTPTPEEDDSECTDCGGSGVTYQTERPCPCQALAGDQK